jgi:hypothetical protein
LTWFKKRGKKIMIKKKFNVTTITAQSVEVVDGAVVTTELPTVTTFANVNEKNKVKRYVEKNDNFNGQLFVTSFKKETVVFEMSEEDFMKYATSTEV